MEAAHFSKISEKLSNCSGVLFTFTDTESTKTKSEAFVTSLTTGQMKES